MSLFLFSSHFYKSDTKGGMALLQLTVCCIPFYTWVSGRSLLFLALESNSASPDAEVHSPLAHTLLCVQCCYSPQLGSPQEAITSQWNIEKFQTFLNYTPDVTNARTQCSSVNCRAMSCKAKKERVTANYCLKCHNVCEVFKIPVKNYSSRIVIPGCLICLLISLCWNYLYCRIIIFTHFLVLAL